MNNRENPTVVFMGTSDFAVPILKKIQSKFNILAVVTERDKPAKRGKKIEITPVKKVAQELNLPIFQPAKIKGNPQFIEELQKISPDIIIVVAYGKLLPVEVLNCAKNGCLNIHPSLLPRYRGASPIQTALLNGDNQTGISIILMDEGMDSGDIIYQELINIKNSDDFITLSKKLAEKSSEIMERVVTLYCGGKLPLNTQNDNEATYCAKIKKSDGLINWKLSAMEIINKLRAYQEWPGTFFYWKEKKIELVEASLSEIIDNSPSVVGQVVKISGKILVKCGFGLLEIKKVKMEGKKSMTIKDFINGHQEFLSEILQ